MSSSPVRVTSGVVTAYDAAAAEASVDIGESNPLTNVSVIGRTTIGNPGIVFFFDRSAWLIAPDQ